MTPEQLAEPATDTLIEQLAETVREQQSHEHPAEGEGADLFCLNLTSYMGGKMGPVLARLRNAEAEAKQQTRRADTAEQQRSAYSDAMHQLVGVIGELQALISLGRSGAIDLNSAEQLNYLDRLVNGKAASATQDVGRRNVIPSERRRLTAEIEQLRSEKDAALAYARRLLAERDTVARAVRSPNLTDAEKLEEIREAFAVVEGQSEETGR